MKMEKVVGHKHDDLWNHRPCIMDSLAHHGSTCIFMISRKTFCMLTLCPTHCRLGNSPSPCSPCCFFPPGSGSTHTSLRPSTMARGCHNKGVSSSTKRTCCTSKTSRSNPHIEREFWEVVAAYHQATLSNMHSHFNSLAHSPHQERNHHFTPFVEEEQINGKHSPNAMQTKYTHYYHKVEIH